MNYVNTILNGRSSDSIPYENGKLLDAPYDLHDLVGPDLTKEFVRGMLSVLRAGGESGVVHLGATRLEFRLN